MPSMWSQSSPQRCSNLQALPGEASRARNGALFLDELRELARQPLADGAVTVARSRLTPTFPARFMLVAAMNPCPCRH